MKALGQSHGDHPGGLLLALGIDSPLAEPGDPAVRVRRMVRRLVEFYGGGRKSCVLDTLTIADTPDDEVGALATEVGYIPVSDEVDAENRAALSAGAEPPAETQSGADSESPAGA